MKILKRVGLALMILLYISAGLNHFLHPESYYPIIPPYLTYPIFINLVSGAIEIVLGLLLIFKSTRKLAANRIVILLALLIQVHVFMIQKGGCMGETICIPAWAAWLRLFPVQFMLMGWAWLYRK